jgi:hypothetical protein
MWYRFSNRADNHVLKTILVGTLLISTQFTGNNGCQEHLSAYPPLFESFQPFVNSPLDHRYYQPEFIKCYWLPLFYMLVLSKLKVPFSF